MKYYDFAIVQQVGGAPEDVDLDPVAAPEGQWVRREDYDALLPLAKFGRYCLDEARGELGDIDGGSAQDKARDLGLLAEVTVDKPCSEDDCTCEAYYCTDEWPVQCLRETDAAKALDKEQA